MKENLEDLTTGSLTRKILIFSIPLIFVNILQMMFTMVDTAVAGRFAGALAIGSIGSVSQIVFFLTGFLSGLGGAINVLAAYFIGKQSKKDSIDIVHTGAVISLLFGLVFLFADWFLSPSVLRLLHTKEELFNDALIYIRIYGFALPFAALYLFGNAILNAYGNTKLPLFFLAAAGIVNVILDLLLVIKFHLGVEGVAYATVTSQAISAVLTLLSVFKPGLFPGTKSIPHSAGHFSFNRYKAYDIIKLGLPAGAQNSVFAFANLVIQAAINSFGAIIVSGISMTNNGDWLVYNIMGAFYQAAATFIGQNYGAGSKKRIRNSYLISLAYSAFIGLTLGLLLYIFGRQFLSLFTTDQDAIGFAMQKFRIMTFSFVISAFMDCTIAANRGLGKTFIPSIFVITGSCIFRVIWVYTVFAHFKTIESLFLLYPASWILTALPTIIYFWIVYKKATKNFN